MKRKAIIISATLAALSSGVVVAWPRLSFYALTGRFWPVHKVESLQNPVTVTGWSPDGLHLADGRTVPLPGLRLLPTSSVALAEATKRGVEIQSDGRVWGLVSVNHWCGNDPVKEHIARVDLSDLLLFLRMGEPVTNVLAADYLAREPGGSFTESGWRVSEFMQFQDWLIMKDSTR